MKTSDLLAVIDKSVAELNRGHVLEWRYPEKKPSDPFTATIKPSWRKFEPGPGPWKKNGKNWFWSEFTFPSSHAGIPLAGTQALLFIHGWMPFTMWVDGKELFREEHAWMATGPIADPFPVPVEPGARHRFVLCIEPTELPGGGLSIHAEFRYQPALETAADIGAVAAELRMAQALARTEAEKSLVEKAAAALDAKSLAGQNWADFLLSAERMEKILAPLSPRAKDLTVHLIGHSHIDMDWMWTWQDTLHCIRRDLKAVSDMMDDFPDLTFTHSQVSTYRAFMESDPEIFRKIVQRIREGRWENAAGTWVEGDLNMADGESIARHILYSADWTLRHMGSKARVLWEPDTFGHPGNMPQIARLGEFDCYFHWRCNPDKYDGWPVWKWVGIDGTSITALSQCYGSDLSAGAIVSRAIRHLRDGFTDALHVWGMGDHGGALSRHQILLMRRFMHRPLIPAVEFSTMGRLVDAIRRQNPKLPSARGQTYTLFEGCFTTHASIKRENRLCEGALLAAETFAVLAGINANDRLRDGWLNTLFNHFHDIFDGAAVHDTYRNASVRSRKALRAAARVEEEALKRLFPSAAPGLVTVANPLGFSRTEPVFVRLPADARWVEDEDGRLLPVQKTGGLSCFVAADVPAFSHRTYRMVHGRRTPAEASGLSVREEGGYFRIETASAVSMLGKAGGIIGSYFDKTLDREFVAYGIPIPLTHVPTTHAELALNVFHVSDESHNGMTAWLINDIMRREYLVRGADVRLVECGPVFARFRVRHAFRSSRIEEYITWYADLNRVDFDIRVDWREKGSEKVGVPQLKVGFACSIAGPRARTEGPFSIREIPADGMEMPTQKWADVTGDGAGFAVLNDCKCGVDMLGSRIRVTLLRNPYFPDLDTDCGRHRVRLAFVPHGPRMSNAELVRRGMAFNRPLRAIAGGKGRRGTAQLRVEGSSDALVCTTMRRAEHSDRIVMRLFNTADQPASARVALGRGLVSAEEVTFLENPVGSNVRLERGAAVLRFRPFEIKTLLCRIKGWA